MLQHNADLHINNIYQKVKELQESSFISSNNNSNNNNCNNNNMSNANTMNSNEVNSGVISTNITSSNIPNNNMITSTSSVNSVPRCKEEEIATEVGNDFNQPYLNNIQIDRNRLVASLGVMLRLVMPLASGVARSVKGIRDVIFLVSLQKITVSRRILTYLFALVANSISLSLSSVQVSQRIELLLQHLKIRKSPQGLESLADTPTPTRSRSTTPTTPTLNNSLLFRNILPEQPAAKCCTLNILAEPPPGMPIRADVVFVHGLHGSQMNTWKQGLWEKDRSPEKFQRPPQLPLRPPKRPRHSRTSGFRPPHKRKRARLQLALKDCDQQFSQSLDEPDLNDHNCIDSTDIQLCTEGDYSFSAFRLRMNDHSRQIQAEFNTRSKLTLDTESTDSINFKYPNHNQPFDVHDTRESTLKSSPNYPEYSKCWPSDWLPLDCPGVRVMALNYTTDQHLWRPLWKKKENRTNLVQRSREMTELLIEHRVGHGHPIIWVGHSKGGLFIKQILVDAWESGRPTAVPLWRSARGVFFYSVPHRGSHLASIKAPLLTRSVELIDIEKNSKHLIDLHRRFVCLYQLGHLKIEVFSFVETALTLLSVLYLRIVGVDSADPGIGDVCGIHLDHREICKPRNRECILYKELIKMIKKVC